MSELGIDLSANDASAQWTPGTVVTLDTEQGSKKYKYVQYSTGAGTVAAVAGNVAGYQKIATAGVGGYIVTSDVSDTDGVGAGVLQAALTDDYYGWVQVSGLATLTTALTAGADGNALTLVGAGDGTLDVSALVTDVVVASALDASAKVIHCMFPL